MDESHGRFFRRWLWLGHGVGIATVLDSELLPDLVSRNLGVGAITERSIAGLLALAQVGFAVFFGDKGLRHKIGSFVRSVTERLAG